MNKLKIASHGTPESLLMLKNNTICTEDTNTQGNDLNRFISTLSAILICFYLSLLVLFSPSVLANIESANKETQMNVQVLAPNGTPLASMIVEVESAEMDKKSTNEKPLAIMDQIDQQFFPHILVVEKGQAVSFPNSDDIKHHVYSFSPTKTFEQQLYKGRDAQPIIFEQSGIVELGCNIHDWMQGFIYVAQGKQYGMTNDSGIASIAIYHDVERIHVWHPLMQEENMRLSVEVSKLTFKNDLYQVRLTKPMIESLSDYERLNIDVY
jgi:plastocyanin